MCKDNKKAIIVIFEASWGQVEWILPVLSKLKDIRPSIPITIFFSSKFKINPNTNYSLLNCIADKIIHFSENDNVKSVIYDNAISNPSIILKENSISAIAKEIQALFPKCFVIAFPDGPYYRICQKFNSLRFTNRWEKYDKNSDLMLVDSTSIAPYLFDFSPDEKMFFSGTPKLDKEWIIKLITQKEFITSDEMKISKQFSKKFLFITTFTHPSYSDFPPDIHDYVINTVVETILGDPENLLIIKPHPRQDQATLMPILQKYNRNQWLISDLQVTQLAALSDLTISVNSSALISALSLKKPVILFHPYAWPSHALAIDKLGRLHSQYDLFGLSVYARTGQELKQHIGNYFDPSSSKDIWERQKIAFNRMFPSQISASEVTAKALLDVIDANDINRLPIFSRSTPVNGEYSLITTHEGKYHLKLKKIQSFVMPLSVVFLKEVAKVFHLKNMILTGTINDHFISESSDIFENVYAIEMASDIYQCQKFSNIQSKKNIYIYNSSNLLDNLLKNLNSHPNFFWLDTHEISTKTFKTKTQTPVIEELKTIKKYNQSEKSLIMINNLKYFQPITPNVDEAKGIGERKYPSIEEVVSIVNEMGTEMKFYVLGNVGIIYSSRYPMSVSSGIQACTISRLFNGSNDGIESVIRSEMYIKDCIQGAEKDTIKCLYDDYISEEDRMCGAHFLLWRGLIYWGENQYQKAKNDFISTHQSGCNHWRIKWYILENAYLSGDISLSKKIIQELIRIVPSFMPVINLSKKLNVQGI